MSYNHKQEEEGGNRPTIAWYGMVINMGGFKLIARGMTDFTF